MQDLKMTISKTIFLIFFVFFLKEQLKISLYIKFHENRTQFRSLSIHVYIGIILKLIKTKKSLKTAISIIFWWKLICRAILWFYIIRNKIKNFWSWKLEKIELSIIDFLIDFFKFPPCEFFPKYYFNKV